MSKLFTVIVDDTEYKGKKFTHYIKTNDFTINKITNVYDQIIQMANYAILFIDKKYKIRFQNFITTPKFKNLSKINKIKDCTHSQKFIEQVKLLLKNTYSQHSYQEFYLQRFEIEWDKKIDFSKNYENTLIEIVKISNTDQLNKYNIYCDVMPVIHKKAKTEKKIEKKFEYKKSVLAFEFTRKHTKIFYFLEISRLLNEK